MSTISDHLQAAIDAAFGRLGEAATYSPLVGDDVDVTVVPTRETDLIDGLGRQGHLVDSALFDVRVSEIATPDIGGTLTISSATYTIREKRHTDPRQMIWRLTTAKA